MKNQNYVLKNDFFKSFYFKGDKLAEPYDFPKIELVEPQTIDEILPFNILMSSSKRNLWMHFFIDDYQFERVYQKPTKYLSLFQSVKGIITPDFSLYSDLPKAIQIYNCYRNRAIACFLQKLGINIIPCVSWSNEDSFEWCFKGIENTSAVAISTNGCFQSKETLETFIKGYHKMCEVIDPKQIILVGKVPKELRKDSKIIAFPNHSMNIKRKEVLDGRKRRNPSRAAHQR